jgi:hypothetical protein
LVAYCDQAFLICGRQNILRERRHAAAPTGIQNLRTSFDFRFSWHLSDVTNKVVRARQGSWICLPYGIKPAFPRFASHLCLRFEQSNGEE